VGLQVQEIGCLKTQTAKRREQFRLVRRQFDYMIVKLVAVMVVAVKGLLVAMGYLRGYNKVRSDLHKLVKKRFCFTAFHENKPDMTTFPPRLSGERGAFASSMREELGRSRSI